MPQALPWMHLPRSKETEMNGPQPSLPFLSAPARLRPPPLGVDLEGYPGVAHPNRCVSDVVDTTAKKKINERCEICSPHWYHQGRCITDQGCLCFFTSKDNDKNVVDFSEEEIK